MKKTGCTYFINSVAEEAGVMAAIIANHIDFWVLRNKEKKKDTYHDGHWWMFSTLDNFRKYFPYMSKWVIWRNIGILKKKELIISKNFREGHKQILWYRPLRAYFLLKNEENAEQVERVTVAPAQSTVADMQSTVADMQSTVADMQSTVADMQSTVAPAQSTVAPAQSTVADMQPYNNKKDKNKNKTKIKQENKQESELLGNSTFSNFEKNKKEELPKNQNKESAKNQNLNIPKIPKKKLDPMGESYQNISHVFAALPDIFDCGGFRHRVDPQNPTNFVKNIIKIIRQLRDGEFYKKNKLDPQWVESRKITFFPCAKPAKSYDGVLHALQEASKKISENRQTGSGYVPKDFLEFLYNPMSKKSMFVYHSHALEHGKNKFKFDLPDDLYSKIQQFLQDYPLPDGRIWTENQTEQFFKACSALAVWYTKNKNRLAAAHLDGEFATACSGIFSFFSKLFFYLGDEKSMYIKPFFFLAGSDSHEWNSFVDWFFYTYQVSLEISDEEEEKINEKRERLDRQEGEQRIINEMEAIRLSWEAEGLQGPEGEELRRRAIENLKEEAHV